MTEVVTGEETERLLDCAAALCARRGTPLTRQRRAVLGLVIDSARPAGAYELMQRLGQGTAPPTVYRALEFLIGAGLVHKVERLSAYVACTHHLHHDHDHARHAAQFLICQQCGRVEEIENEAPGAALAGVAVAAGFTMRFATIEAEGTCRACA